MSTTINATDNPHVRAVIARRDAGEPSVRGYSCGNGCGWLEKPTPDRFCPECGCQIYMAWGYWGTCDEHPGSGTWFYPLSEIREAAAADEAQRTQALLNEIEHLRSL